MEVTRRRRKEAASAERVRAKTIAMVIPRLTSAVSVLDQIDDNDMHIQFLPDPVVHRVPQIYD